MSLDPSLVHPGVLAKVADPSGLPSAALPLWESVYVDTLTALDRSLRSPTEMAEAARVLNPMLDARAKRAATGDEEGVTRLDEIAGRALEAAIGARDARSGMAVENRLDSLRTALDEGERELTEEGRSQARS